MVAHSTPRIAHVEVVGVVEADVAVVAALEPETGAYACGLDEIQTLTRIAPRLTAVVAEWRNPECLWMILGCPGGGRKENWLEQV